MKIIRNFQNIDSSTQGAVLTLGNFDGVHLGHQKILQQIRQIAAQKNAPSALLTFEPHPRKIIQPDQYNQHNRLMSLAQKLRFLQDKIDAVFLSRFSLELSKITAADFARDILVGQLKISHLVVGYDFTFGRNRSGDSALLQQFSKQYGFGFTQIAADQNDEKQIYSSTKIRKLINQGEIKAANSMLARPYQIEGIVSSGKKLARNLGFPTANFKPKADLTLPRFGVYQVLVKISNHTQKFPAIMNFGIKPTFDGEQPCFEIHIFNFNEDIYGKKITVELLDFIRPEQKFASIEELKLQIKKDCHQVQNAAL